MILAALGACLVAQVPVELSVSSGATVPYGEVAPGYSAGPGPVIQVDALLRVGRSFRVGLAVDAVSGPVTAVTDSESVLAEPPFPMWGLGLGAKFEVRPVFAARVSPFASAQLGWQLASTGHGPRFGAAVGIDFKPSERLPLWLGLALNETLGVLSNPTWPPIERGVGLRTVNPSGTIAQPGWGSRWTTVWWSSVVLRLRITF